MGDFSKSMGALGYKMLHSDAQGDVEQHIKRKKGVRRSTVRENRKQIKERTIC